MHDARAEAKHWLAAAHEDLEYARHASAGGYHAPACFFAQQAAEKRAIDLAERCVQASARIAGS